MAEPGTGIFCDYCGQNPGCKKNSIIWNGFKDAGNGKHVCWGCRDRHYIGKQIAAATFLTLPSPEINNKPPIVHPLNKLQEFNQAN